MFSNEQRSNISDHQIFLRIQNVEALKDLVSEKLEEIIIEESALNIEYTDNTTEHITVTINNINIRAEDFFEQLATITANFLKQLQVRRQRILLANLS